VRLLTTCEPILQKSIAEALRAGYL
jgi:Winged helix DNA-binding domain